MFYRGTHNEQFNVTFTYGVAQFAKGTPKETITDTIKEAITGKTDQLLFQTIKISCKGSSKTYSNITLSQLKEAYIEQQKQYNTLLQAPAPSFWTKRKPQQSFLEIYLEYAEGTPITVSNDFPDFVTFVEDAEEYAPVADILFDENLMVSPIGSDYSP